MDTPHTASTPPAPVNRTIEGALWALASAGLLSALAALGRQIAHLGVEPMLIVFFRLVFAFLCLMPWFLMRGIGRVGTSQMKLYFVRSISSVCAMTTWFYAVSMLPIGEVTALGFLAPLFTTIGAALFLGEVVRVRRWTATLVGLLGAMIIIRPGLVEMGAGSWFALSSAVFMGISSLFIKRLTRGDDPTTVVFFSHLVTIPMAAIPAAFLWHWPAPEMWPYLLATGPLAVLGHIALTKSFALADASLVATFDFAKLPWAVLIGWLAFGELSDVWTWIGAAVIFSSSLYIVRRESKIKRAA